MVFNEEKQLVTIQYREVKNYCGCCERSLDEPLVSHAREYDFEVSDLVGAEWVAALKDDLEYGDHNFDKLVKEWLFDTIRFYAFESDEADIQYADDDDKELVCLARKLCLLKLEGK